MGVKITEKSTDKSTDKIVSFNKDEFMVVEGLEGSFFKGKNKVVHKIQAQKLIDKKLAKEVKGVDFEVTTDENRTVKEVKTDK